MPGTPTKNNSVGAMSHDMAQKNTFLQVDPDISKAAYILRSFTSPLNMLASASEDGSSSESDGSSSERHSQKHGSGLPVSKSSRRRSVVVPFGNFEAGEVVSVGMLDVQEKLKHVEITPQNGNHLGDNMPTGRMRRGSVMSVFFSPDHSADGADECPNQKLADANEAIKNAEQSAMSDSTLDSILNRQGSGKMKKVLAKQVSMELDIPKKDSPVKKQAAKKVGNSRGIDLSDPKFAGELVMDGVPESLCTTLMVRNIPNKYTQRLLVNLFKKYGFDQTFDFLYAPVDFNTRLNVGYCFINFTEPEYAQAFARRFHAFQMPAFKSRKKIHISLANLQGLQPNIKKLVDSSLMVDTVAPEYQPLLFCCKTGRDLPFPSPANIAVEKVENRLDASEHWAQEDSKLVATWAGTVFPRNAPAKEKQHNGPARHQTNPGNLERDPAFFNQSVGSMTPPPSPPQSSRGLSFGDRFAYGNSSYTPTYSMPPSTPPYGRDYSPTPYDDQFGFTLGLTPPGLTPKGTKGSKGKGKGKGFSGFGDHHGDDWSPPPRPSMTKRSFRQF